MTSLRGLGPLSRLVAAASGERAVESLFARWGLPHHPDVARGMIPLSSMVGLFEDAAHLTGDPQFGLSVGVAMMPTDYGPWVTYSMQEPQLRRALERMSRSLWLHQSGTRLVVREDRGHARVSYLPGPPRHFVGRHHLDHIILPMIRFIGQYAGGGWVPLAVELPYADGPWRRAVEAATGAPVRFGCSACSLVFERALLDRVRADVPPSRLTFADIRRMTAVEPPSTMAETVLAALHLRLLDSACDIEGTAAFLGIGPRTLQRRLSDEGTTYRILVDRARFVRARGLLGESALTVTQIAMDLGYEDSAHFTRAFRRWAGTTPSAWRRCGSSVPPVGRGGDGRCFSRLGGEVGAPGWEPGADGAADRAAAAGEAERPERCRRVGRQRIASPADGDRRAWKKSLDVRAFLRQAPAGPVGGGTAMAALRSRVGRADASAPADRLAGGEREEGARPDP